MSARRHRKQRISNVTAAPFDGFRRIAPEAVKSANSFRRKEVRRHGIRRPAVPSRRSRARFRYLQLYGMQGHAQFQYRRPGSCFSAQPLSRPPVATGSSDTTRPLGFRGKPRRLPRIQRRTPVQGTPATQKAVGRWIRHVPGFDTNQSELAESLEIAQCYDLVRNIHLNNREIAGVPKCPRPLATFESLRLFR